MSQNINFKLFLYLISLLCFSYFFLYLKYPVPNDSTISEWLINYEGGFTKRGIIGQIAIFLSRTFDQNLRWIIYILQIISCSIYFILLFNFLKDIKHNRLTLLAIFAPIFILYPIAEIEVLARKEIIVFSLYITYLFFPKIKYFKKISFILFLILAVLVWEPVIFYLPLIFLIELIENKISKINFDFFKIIFLFIPGIIVAFYIAFNPITSENHDLMSNILKNEFGETCYMSCALLKSKSTILDQLNPIDAYTFERVFRYIMIFLIGFGPIFILFKNSILINKNIIFLKNFSSLFYPAIISLLPVIIIFAIGYDWGRWVNISYVFTAIFFFYLFKNQYIYLNQNIKNNFLNKMSKKIFVFIFIIFCFGWNPKTALTGDIASFPGYRIPYKTLSFFIRGHL